MRRLAGSTAFLVALALVAATTGSIDAASDTTEPAAGGGPASGEPVRIGWVNIQGGASVSLPDYTTGAEAAVAYANEELGGIAGRPIELVHCYTDATPESSISCGNQMVDEDVVLVTLGTDANAASLAEVVVGAEIPYVTNTGNSQIELTDPHSFAWTAGVPSALAAYATYSSEQGYDKFTVLVIDNPAATGAIDTLGQLVFGNAGVELDSITVPPGTPDMTPQLQAAIDGGADMVGVLGDTNMCTAFYTAYGTLGASVPAAVFNACLGEQILASAPANLLENLFVPQKLRVDDEGEEGELFRRVLETYSDGADPTSPIVAAGYATVLGIARMLDGLEGDVNAGTVAAQLAVGTAAYPMAPGSELNCDSSAIPALPRVCSATEFWYRVTPDRTLEYIDTYDVAPLFVS